MNVNPISDFFKHTKVIMNADDEPFMIQLTILDELALQTMLQNIMSKSHCKNLDAIIKDLAALYMRLLIKTQTYQNFVMFVHDEKLLTQSVLYQVKNKLVSFRYLQVLHNFLAKKPNASFANLEIER
tara:strand:- start:906 stop:1286 length:381 start_codon:yes stop_codon:yes gene_type:complete